MRVTFETAGNPPWIEGKLSWFCAEKCLPIAEQASLLQLLMMKSLMCTAGLLLYPLTSLEMPSIISAPSMQQSCMLKSWPPRGRVLPLWVGGWPSWFLISHRPSSPCPTIWRVEKKLHQGSLRDSRPSKRTSHRRQRAGPWSLISSMFAFFLCFTNTVLAKHHLSHERRTCKQVSFQTFLFFFFLNVRLDCDNGRSLLPELKLYQTRSCVSAQEEP